MFRVIATRLKRLSGSSYVELGNMLALRATARGSAVLFLAGAIVMGLGDGGHLAKDGNAYRKIGGYLAGFIGYAARDIRISGLVHQDAEAVLTTIGVQPGGSLIGFDAAQARRLLENVDWVDSARVVRLFPNQLEITVMERKPFAIWQRDSRYYVIDRSGSAISSLAPGRFSHLLLVTGEGAQLAAAALDDQLFNFPDLKARVKAAARAGQRRWDLLLDNGVTISLPEQNSTAALQEAERLDRLYGLLSKGITRVDMRLAGQTAIGIAQVAQGAAGTDSSFRVSGRQ
jgi:cell division protein FtsQ